MIIKEIELNNIRSHTKSNIEFTTGITVLSGRTGCGKSTILMSIAYALFGSTSGINNNALLRRGATKGHVKLVFNHKGKEYEIMRGVKRSGTNIIVNPNELWIKENGIKIPIIARTTELNQKILEIIGYPSDVNPKELFELITYAKQDEIRKLIEMTSAEREKYIDRVLQLSKYEATHNNLRPVINSLRNEESRLNGLISGLENVSEELIIKEKELSSSEEELRVIKNELSKARKELQVISKERNDKKELLDKLELIKSDYDKTKGLIIGYEQELNKIKDELKIIGELRESRLSEAINNQTRINSELISIKKRIIELTRELNDFKQLKGKCPTCHQPITPDYSKKFSEETTMRIKELELRKQELSNELIKAEKEVNNERIIDEKNKQARNLNERKKIIQEKLKELRIKTSSDVTEKLSKARREYEEINNKYLEAMNKTSSLSNKEELIIMRNKRLRDEINKLKENVKLINKSKKELKEIQEKNNFIKKLREDIRNIRVIVRARFLEDFRHEFQKKFEEIRQEDTYTVDINNNYEPIAYADRTETSINALSGGEKTSIALSYRLALSELATKASSVNNNELLLLDEPTTGFDRRDITNLPKMLRGIRIPQVIIITHEDELKEAADNKYELIKRENETIINP